MIEENFSAWLKDNNISKKVASDYISRIKKFEHSIKNCDIDEEYHKNRCSEILDLDKTKKWQAAMMGTCQ